MGKVFLKSLTEYYGSPPPLLLRFCFPVSVICGNHILGANDPPSDTVLEGQQ